MKAMVYQNSIARAVPFEEAVALRGQAEIVWLHLEGNRPGAIAWIEAQGDIPPVAKEALKATETRPRSDIVDGGAIVNIRGLAEEDGNVADPLVSVRLWATGGLVVSFAFRTPHALDDVERQFTNGEIHDPGDLITAFATMMSVGLDPEIAIIGDRLDEIEASVDEQYSRSIRRQCSNLRAEAISYRRFIAPQREALMNLSVQRLPWLDEEDRLHLRTAADRYARMAEELEAVRERAAIVHDEITDLRGERMDGRALLTAIIALIFLPLTFITGLLGMNVEGIPYAKEPWAFWGVVVFCVAIGIVVMAYFVHLRWVRGR
jgi:zinc transporter